MKKLRNHHRSKKMATSLSLLMMLSGLIASQASATEGFESLPGERSCLFRYGPVSADPYINVAYPDAAVKYWGAAFSIPKGAKMHLEGEFPYSRYMSLISYDEGGRPVQSLPDYAIKPLEGSDNPYRVGNSRDNEQRSYYVKVRDAKPSEDYTGALVRDGFESDVIHAPSYANGQQVLIYRIYAQDQNTGETAGSPLPTPVVTLADGKELRGQDACDALNAKQMLRANFSALGIPVAQYIELADQPDKPLGFPATNPAKWHIQLDRKSLLGIFTGDIDPNSRRSEGGFYPNLDNNYIRTVVNRKLGPVFVLRAKAPTTPKTFNGDKTMGTGDLRYWSVCSNKGFANTRVNDCLYDEHIPVDQNGYFTVVVSRESDRPRNAFPECGIGWIPMADDGDGVFDEDASIVQIRHMLAKPEFRQAIQNIYQDKDIPSVMGEYFPKTFYTTTSKFELFFPCSNN
ncbi:hypothetical protein [Grimontia sp. AD028]|uniref:hypothetical protein n=1 Tax=Grimontia sp. AD028 TaxID=1581149 RepID=UPI000B1E22DE|nr:hypothetical protein [Grimontia sp. AD028]